MRQWRLYVTLLALVLLIILVPQPAPIRAATAASEADTLAQEVVARTNIERVNQGLPPLKYQDNLKAAAMWSGQDMADKNYFDHTDSQGRTSGQRIMAFGYTNPSITGENIAAGQADPAAALVSWMNSQGHRENILRASFCEIGAGYGFSTTSTYTRYWVQTFGCRPDVYPVIINNEAASTTSPHVNLYLYGTGTAKEMRLSNDGVNWSDWETFVATRAWTLDEGNGTRTVYVQLRNGSSMWAANDTITLVTTPTPTTTTTPSTESPRFYLPLLMRAEE